VIPLLDLILLTGAVARLTRLAVYDRILETPRAWILRRFPADDTQFGDSEIEDYATGPGITGSQISTVRGDDGWWYAESPHFLGNLISCPWCLSIWIAAPLLTAYWLWPEPTLWIAAFLTVSFLAGWVTTFSE
jgi:hypothetical protein